MKPLSELIKKLAFNQQDYWITKFKDEFDIICQSAETGHKLDPILLRQTYLILSSVPNKLIRDCGVEKLYFSATMGPNRPFYPNHGFYLCTNQSVTLNEDIFYNPDMPDDFFDTKEGYFLSRTSQTIYHEYSHAFDFNHGDLSEKSPWTDLSGWSRTYKPGLKRLIINDPGTPQVVGEWFFDPQTENKGGGFTRFYGKRNPADDFADCSGFFMANLRNKIPINKLKFLDNLLGPYYKK